MGRGDKERLAKTFSSALIVHIIIALIVFLFAETVGLWYVYNKLNIPEGRMTAAHIVYQLSILSSMFSVTQVPYNSSIIAHEKMDVYAYVEILNVSLKFLIVYLLLIGNFDKLILYAVLVLTVSFLVMMVYRIYCLRHFSETHFHFVWDKEYLKPLLSFSGWNLFGNFGYVVGNQATNLVINSFFGVIMNAAASIALTVCGIVTQFASNAMTAFRPPITKSYANGDIIGMQSLTLFALKTIMILYTLVAIPVYIECDTLLNIWLVDVPPMASMFCRILLISIFFETMCQIVTINVHATGNVKLISALSGTIFCISPFIVYILYYLSFPVQFSFVVLAANNVFRLFVYIFILKHYISDIEKKKYFTTIVLIIVTSLVTLCTMKILQVVLEQNFLRLCIITVTSSILQAIFFVTIVLSSKQRTMVYEFVKSKVKRV